MGCFAFEKVDGKYIWESNFMRLEFFEPSIEGSSDYIQIYKEEDIVHYHYTVQAFRKIKSYDICGKIKIENKLIYKKTTYKASSLIELKKILEAQLENDILVSEQRVVSSNGEVLYLNAMSTNELCYDDFYEIKKVQKNIKDKNSIRYAIYTGAAFSCKDNLNGHGMKTPYIKAEDIKELLKCVSSFIEYSINEYNKDVSTLTIDYKLKGNKIYAYEDCLTDSGKTESIYAAGDSLDIIVIKDNIQTNYDDVIFSKVEGNNIIFENGLSLDFNSIVYMSSNVIEETKEIA